MNSQSKKSDVRIKACSVNVALVTGHTCTHAQQSAVYLKSTHKPQPQCYTKTTIYSLLCKCEGKHVNITFSCITHTKAASVFFSLLRPKNISAHLFWFSQSSVTAGMLSIQNPPSPDEQPVVRPMIKNSPGCSHVSSCERGHVEVQYMPQPSAVRSPYGFTQSECCFFFR